MISQLGEQLKWVFENARADLDIQKTQAKMQIEALTEIINYYKTTSASYVGQMNGINVVSASA